MKGGFVTILNPFMRESWSHRKTSIASWQNYVCAPSFRIFERTCCHPALLCPSCIRNYTIIRGAPDLATDCLCGVWCSDGTASCILVCRTGVQIVSCTLSVDSIGALREYRVMWLSILCQLRKYRLTKNQPIILCFNSLSVRKKFIRSLHSVTSTGLLKA